MQKISSILLENPFVLAPLAGYTDLPFRLLCREYGAALVFSEMISCHGLVYDQKKTLSMLASHLDERPVAMQLFGSEPDIMGEAAKIIAEHPIDIIDINMGCPVKKVIKKGAGAALMRHPKLAEKVISEVVKNSNKPVTVKFRSGWNHHTITAPEFAKMAEGAGAQAVTVHARTWSDGFSGTVDWDLLSRVKENVSIPVIGNGDIESHDEGLSMIKKTGCDAVMIGRCALGAPWIFSPEQPMAGMRVRTKALTRHLELIESFLSTDRSLGKIKNHVCKYFKGTPGSASLRTQIFDTKSFQELVDLANTLYLSAR
nr:tRNA dihydrouridine synthase DusB [Desulfobulbaceae bacterium]